MQCPFNKMRKYKIIYRLRKEVKVLYKTGCTLVEVGEYFEDHFEGWILSIYEVNRDE